LKPLIHTPNTARSARFRAPSNDLFAIAGINVDPETAKTILFQDALRAKIVQRRFRNEKRNVRIDRGLREQRGN
jgi:hypothetical protein